jgi:hypothetical protein
MRLSLSLILLILTPQLAQAASPAPTWAPEYQRNVPASICQSYKAPPLTRHDKMIFNSQDRFADFEPGDRVFVHENYHKAFHAYYAMFFCSSSYPFGESIAPEMTDNDSSYLLQEGLRLCVEGDYTKAEAKFKNMTPGKNADGIAYFFLGTLKWTEGHHSEATSYWYRSATTSGYLQQEYIRVPDYVHSSRFMLTHLSKINPPPWRYGDGPPNSDSF